MGPAPKTRALIVLVETLAMVEKKNRFGNVPPPRPEQTLVHSSTAVELVGQMDLSTTLHYSSSKRLNHTESLFYYSLSQGKKREGGQPINQSTNQSINQSLYLKPTWSIPSMACPSKRRIFPPCSLESKCTLAVSAARASDWWSVNIRRKEGKLFIFPTDMPTPRRQEANQKTRSTLFRP